MSSINYHITDSRIATRYREPTLDENAAGGVTGRLGSALNIITEAQYAELLANGRAAREAAHAGLDFDPKPVVKLFTPHWYARWQYSPSGRAVRAPALARHRRVRGATLTRLTDSRPLPHPVAIANAQRNR